MMGSAGFFPEDGGVDDEAGGSDEVAELEDVGCHGVAPVEVAHFAAEILHAVGGAAQSVVGADDRNVVLHGAAEFVPGVVDVDEFVGRRGVATFPFGNFGSIGDGLAGREAEEDVRKGAAGHDVCFEKAVGGETVGTMETGAGDLADGEKSADAGASIEVGDDASALIMRGGDHGDGLLERVVPEAEEGLVDEREALGELVAKRGDVEEDARRTGALDLGIDGPGDDVTRGERAAWVVVVDELVALLIDENRAFAADGFGDEKGAGFGAGGGGVVETGRVKLDELHVRDGGAGAPGHRKSVARRGVGVGGVEVSFSAAPGGENDTGRFDHADFVLFDIENIGAENAVIGDRAELARRDEIDGVVIF